MAPIRLDYRGGAIEDKTAVDVLYDGKDFHILGAEKFDTAHTHGAGCTSSAAICAGLALGRDVLTAVKDAKRFVTNAIRESFPLNNLSVPSTVCQSSGAVLRVGGGRCSVFLRSKVLATNKLPSFRIIVSFSAGKGLLQGIGAKFTRGDRMAVKIITDSACDLPQDLIREYDIEVVPLLVVMDGKEYADGQDISPEHVYSAIRAGKVLTTNQAPAHFFRRVFTECVARGMSCIYIAFSSKLSGTCHTGMMVARQVREETQGDIEVVDTLCGSLGQGLLVLEAAKMAKAGAGKEQIVARVQGWPGTWSTFLPSTTWNTCVGAAASAGPVLMWATCSISNPCCTSKRV